MRVNLSWCGCLPRQDPNLDVIGNWWKWTGLVLVVKSVLTSVMSPFKFLVLSVDISGSLLEECSLTQVGHCSIRSLMWFEIPGHHTKILARRRHFYIP